MAEPIKLRYHYLDKLRVFLTCVVIFHHTAIAFGASGGWYYKSSELWKGWSQALMSLVMGIDQSYFMALFFFISALLMPASYERKGVFAFLKDRAIRLGIPLLIYIFFLNPAIVGLVGELRGVAVDWGRLFWHYHTPGPMWFVLTLIVFELLYVWIPNPASQIKDFNAEELSICGEVDRFHVCGGRGCLSDPFGVSSR